MSLRTLGYEKWPSSTACLRRYGAWPLGGSRPRSSASTSNTWTSRRTLGLCRPTRLACVVCLGCVSCPTGRNDTLKTSYWPRRTTGNDCVVSRPYRKSAHSSPSYKFMCTVRSCDYYSTIVKSSSRAYNMNLFINDGTAETFKLGYFDSDLFIV